MTRRWLIRSLFILPLLLCVVGWGWSMWHQGRIRGSHGNYFFVGATKYGVIELECGRWPVFPGSRTEWGYDSLPWGLAAFPEHWPGLPPNVCECRSRPFAFMGLRYWYYARGIDGEYDSRWLQVPYYLLVLLFGLVLFFAWRKTRPRTTYGAFPVELATRKEPP